MSVDYDHSSNLHAYEGPHAAFPHIFTDRKPTSLLDVGCGLGIWLKVAVDYGTSDVFGIDGVAISEDQLLIPAELFQQHDLTLPIDLGRRFDVALCLEVAEHLDERFAKTLVRTLTNHADVIIFAAASPYQPGQHHVNCQWPIYWQELFNQEGYVCSDDVRWRMWNNSKIDAWYQQNTFIARLDPIIAGKEERIKPVIHPKLLPFIETQRRVDHIRQIENGAMPMGWYLRATLKGLFSKVQKRVFNPGILFKQIRQI